MSISFQARHPKVDIAKALAEYKKNPSGVQPQPFYLKEPFQKLPTDYWINLANSFKK